MSLLFLFLLPFIVAFAVKKLTPKKSRSTLVNTTFPKWYPLIGSFIELAKQRKRQRITQWTSDLLQISPSATFVLDRGFGRRVVFTADPVNVRRILTSHFHVYPKGGIFRRTVHDFLGDGIFNADGESWRLQRKVSSREFSTRSLRRFVETVVDGEVRDRLVPVLSGAESAGSELDLQDVLQRFAFDSVCKIAFGFDPACLSPERTEARFAAAFEDGVRLSNDRFGEIFPSVWKVKRFFGIGSERRLRIAIEEVREFARIIIREKKKQLDLKSEIEFGKIINNEKKNLVDLKPEIIESVDLKPEIESTRIINNEKKNHVDLKSEIESADLDLLSRFLTSGHSDEKFVTDIIISFVLAGRDTTSAALTWFFWIISRNPSSEAEIVNEITSKSENTQFEEIKNMPYTHAALCESMRLYPPVPIDSKEAENDDVWDDGTAISKGMRVVYHPYAMGRSEKLWGPDWADFRPERWLRRAHGGASWSFVARDAHDYPVFQAGPRVCLGKEMSFLQMNKVVSCVMRDFRIVPRGGDVEPGFLTYLTSKMRGGLPVLVERRTD